jgi:hypothetical protein
MAFLAGLALAGCVKAPPRPVPQIIVEPPAESEKWTQIATAADENRIASIGQAWSEAVQQARKTNPQDVRVEGDLLRPDAALARPALTPGSYYCRLVKLGRVRARGPSFERFKPFFCYVDVEGELLTLVKQTGTERPAGRLWDDDVTERLVFLGSLTTGNETKQRAYGEDPKRDLAGVVERIAPFRWRLVIPWPQSNSKLDVYELTPVEKQPV